jgi:nicotinamidase/pyrazinamidase
MRTVFFDVDTQIDFLFPAGALYVPGAERLLPTLAKLNHAAPLLVSTVDAHAEDDPEFRDWPPHCVAGTAGQQKPCELLREPRVVVPSTPGEYRVDGASQIIVEKQALDMFSNPNLPGLLKTLDAGRYVVYGVVAEICVRYALEGLTKTGRPVEVVTDAIQALDEAASRRALDAFVAAGGRLTTAAEVLRQL